MDSFVDSVANRIRIALDVRKMKQVDLVELTCIGKPSISMYLSGKYEPKQNRIYLIAKALDVSETWLMGLDVPMERGSESSTDPRTATDADIKFALFGDTEIDDDVMAEVRDYAKFVAERKQREKLKHDNTRNTTPSDT